MDMDVRGKHGHGQKCEHGHGLDNGQVINDKKCMIQDKNVKQTNN